MSLVSSSKTLYGRDIPGQKHSQLISVFDRLFLLCGLYEDLPLSFMLCLKLSIIVFEMASAFLE